MGLETDPLGALARMAGLVESAGCAAGVRESLWMTLAVSDGQRLYAVRYATDGQAPTLYHTRDAEEVFEVLPDLRGRLSPETRVIASEPAGRAREIWVEVPQSSSVVVERGEITVRPFAPVAPGPEPYRKVEPIAFADATGAG
jgi:glutamine amidotransferase